MSVWVGIQQAQEASMFHSSWRPSPSNRHSRLHSCSEGIMLYHQPFYMHSHGIILLCMRHWRISRRSEWWASPPSVSPLFSPLLTESPACHLSGIGQPVKQSIYSRGSFYLLPVWIRCLHDHYFAGKGVAERENKKLTLNAPFPWVTENVLWCLAISTE